MQRRGERDLAICKPPFSDRSFSSTACTGGMRQRVRKTKNGSEKSSTKSLRASRQKKSLLLISKTPHIKLRQRNLTSHTGHLEGRIVLSSYRSGALRRIAFARLERQADGTFKDEDLANILHNAYEPSIN